MYLLDLESKLRKLRGDFTKLSTDIQASMELLAQRVAALDKIAKDWRYTTNAAGLHTTTVIKQIEHLQKKLSSLEERLELIEREPPEIGVAEVVKAPPSVILDDVLPVTSPTQVAKDVVKLVQTWMDSEGVKRADNRLYVDLAHPAIKDMLPYGLTPRQARDALKKARVAKRHSKPGLKEAGWVTMPPFGVVLEL